MISPGSLAEEWRWVVGSPRFKSLLRPMFTKKIKHDTKHHHAWRGAVLDNLLPSNMNPAYHFIEPKCDDKLFKRKKDHISFI